MRVREGMGCLMMMMIMMVIMNVMDMDDDAGERRSGEGIGRVEVVDSNVESRAGTADADTAAVEERRHDDVLDGGFRQRRRGPVLTRLYRAHSPSGQ